MRSLRYGAPECVRGLWDEYCSARMILLRAIGLDVQIEFLSTIGCFRLMVRRRKASLTLLAFVRSRTTVRPTNTKALPTQAAA